MFTAHEVGEKEADSFIPAHTPYEAHSVNHTHTHTHTHTQGRDKWAAELQATMKEVRLERRPERTGWSVGILIQRPSGSIPWHGRVRNNVFPSLEVNSCADLFVPDPLFVCTARTQICVCMLKTPIIS